MTRGLLLLLLIISPLTQAAEWGQSELMALLALSKGSEQHYTETKQLAFLDIAVVSKGRLSFSPPDKMVKQVEEPNPSRYEIDGSTITVTAPGQAEQIIDMDNHPQLRLFIDTLKAVLSGDQKYLVKHYLMTLTGERSGWQLQLSPLDEEMAVIIESLIIVGQNQYIDQMVTREKSGDKTTLTFRTTRD